MKRKRYVLLVSIFLLVLLIVFAGASGMSRPEKSAQVKKEATVQPERTENPDYDEPEKNLLTLNKEKRVTEAVNQYYIDQAGKMDYIDYYKDIEVYRKDGPYVGTYVVFAKYNIKIKGIYTEVPGLTTFYATVDDDQEWVIDETISTDEEKEAVQKVSAHTDVKELVERTEKEYEEAIASDAILREAIMDLENACGDVP